jgi:hypothetical protein
MCRMSERRTNPFSIHISKSGSRAGARRRSAEHAASRASLDLLAAAARIAQAHGGTLDARRRESGGCALMLTLRT